MPAKLNIPVQSLSEMLDDLSYNWHSPDYYISPGEAINTPTFTSAFRPNFYGLVLCTKGWLDLEINQAPVHIGPFCFFGAGPDMIFKRMTQSPDCETRSLFFTKEFLMKNIVSQQEFDTFHFLSTNGNSCIQVSEPDAAPLLQVFDVLKNKREDDGSPYYLEIIRHLIFAYIYETATLYEAKGIGLPKSFSRGLDLKLKFQHLLTRHSAEEHQLKFYADALCISTQYLIYAVKKSSGKTPGEMIDEAIISIAKMKLKDAKLPLATIAHDLHFSDQAAFSRFFKRQTAISPLKFRKEG